MPDNFPNSTISRVVFENKFNKIALQNNQSFCSMGKLSGKPMTPLYLKRSMVDLKGLKLEKKSTICALMTGKDKQRCFLGKWPNFLLIDKSTNSSLRLRANKS